MLRFVVRRLVQGAFTVLGITVLTFLLMRLAPGDPLSLMVAGNADLNADDMAALRQAYGLDLPLPGQYAAWLSRAAAGDLGQSLLYHRPVSQMIATALPNTLQLSGLALLVALGVGVPLGVAAAYARGSWLDHLIRVASVVGHAVPPFWLGLIFILVFSVQLRLFPVGGMLTVGASEWNVGDRLIHLVGPVLTLALAGIANYTRFLRTEVLEVLGREYVTTAHSKGLSARAVRIGHVLRNALMPVVTALGSVLAALVSGALVVEQVFSWPGMGRLTFDAARAKDYPVVMGVVLILSVLVMTSFLLRDLAYALVDPRVRNG
jgi:peptide/nickel transport system permease protein